MQEKSIVNGVNQAGKAATPEDQVIAASVKKKDTSFMSGFMSVLNAFAHFVSPIKDNRNKRM